MPSENLASPSLLCVCHALLYYNPAIFNTGTPVREITEKYRILDYKGSFF
jgi:hypothetical protein